MQSVPQQRIREKLDEYMSRRDYKGVERHLLYWLEEARMGGDRRGELMILNEMVGHYRKTGEKEKSLESGREALALLKEMDYENTTSAGTTYVNVATACNAFGENARAMELFEQARGVYEGSPGTPPQLLGGLYNNMALTCVTQGRFDQAYALYDRAMEQMGQVPNGVLEQAITCLNIANAVEDQWGLEQGQARIDALLEQAAQLLATPSVPRDGYYAFVCEKCAPSFEYYGYFLEAEALQQKAKDIYERS